MKDLPRLFIYTADLVRISGKCERSCQRMLQQIREHFGLQKRQGVTLHHLSSFLSVPVEQISPYILY